MQLFFNAQSVASYDPSSTPIDIYLSSTGNDANNGSVSAPVRTFSRVWEFLPLIQTRPFVVHVDGGSAATLSTVFDWVVPPKNLQLGESAFIVIYGDGGGVAGHDGFYEVATGTVTGASTNTSLTVTGGGMAVNAYQNMTVEMLTGVATGHRRSIVENTATIIYPICSYADEVGSGATLTPGNGDAFRVVRPNVTLDFADAIFLCDPDTRLHLVNVGVQNTSGNFGVFQTSSIQSLWFGIEFRTGSGNAMLANSLICVGCGVTATADAYYGYLPTFSQQELPKLLAALGQPIANTSGAWHGWGATYLGNDGTGPFSNNVSGAGQGLRLFGFLCGFGLYLDGDQFVGLIGFNLTNAYANTGSTCYLDSQGLDFAASRTRLGGLSTSFISVYSNATMVIGWMNGAQDIQITQTAGATVGIFVGLGGAVYNYGNMTGTGLANAGDIIRFEHGAVFSHTGGAISLTGAAGARCGTFFGGSLQLFNAFTVSGTSELTLNGGEINLVEGSTLTLTASSSRALLVRGGAKVTSRGTVSLTGTLADGGALEVVGAGSSYHHIANDFTARNNSAGANADGIRVEQGGTVSLLNTAACSSGGASGYGARLRACGTITFSGQLGGGWSGPTNDLLVDATAIAKAALVANTATTGAGGSRAVAMT